MLALLGPQRSDWGGLGQSKYPREGICGLMLMILGMK